MGSIYRCLVSKVSIKWVIKDVAHYLNEFQFGVRVSSGVEAILYSANRMLSKRHINDSLDMITVDLSNSFNMVN